ncbi:MAG: hypothetical protein U1A78_17215 [Polyangia bacterium]
MLVPIILWLLAALPAGRVTVSTVPCKTVSDCWLDEDGKPIARPHAKRGRKLPRGDCGRNLLWLRNRLSCEDNVCVARHIGDAC